MHSGPPMKHLLFFSFLGGLLAIATGGCGSSGRTATGTAGATCGDAGPGVTFQLEYDGLLCLGSVCGENWLTIADSNGTAIPFLPGVIQCSECSRCDQQPNSCYLGCPISPPYTGPESIVWSGGVYPSSTCGDGTGCTTSSCAPPGTYTATMCLHAATGDGGEDACDFAQQPKVPCKSFAFQWPPGPAATTVTWSP